MDVSDFSSDGGTPGIERGRRTEPRQKFLQRVEMCADGREKRSVVSA